MTTLSYDDAKHLVIDILTDLQNKVLGNPDEFIANYNLFTLKRDILLYMYILQMRVGTIDVGVLCFLITGYYGSEDNQSREIRRILGGIDTYVTVDFMGLLAIPYTGANPTLELSLPARRAIQEAFSEFYEVGRTFLSRSITAFDFVAEINLINPLIPDFSEFIYGELSTIFADALANKTLQITPIPDSKLSNTTSPQFAGQLFHLRYQDQWECIWAVVANEGAFTHNFLRDWALEAQNARGYLQVEQRRERINILLVASDTSDAEVSQLAVKIPYFYHAWPMASFRLLLGLQELVQAQGAEAILKCFESMFPEAIAAHFSPTLALAALKKKLPSAE